MKIAMTSVDLPNEGKGGVPHQVHFLANVLAERGHEVTMFSLSPAYADCRYTVHQYSSSERRIRMHALYTYFFAACLARTDFTNFDVVHVNGDNYLLRHVHPQLRTFYGSAKEEANSAVRLRRRINQRLIARLEDIGARLADVSVGISHTTQASLPNIKHIIPCGVNTTAFSPRLKSDHPSILFVGTSGGRKRGNLLADVFNRMIRPCFPDAQLWTVMERPIEGEGIINFGRVSFDHLTDLYGRAWLFCLPSTYEGFGVPYIEAMASGTAVVASPNPGAKEVLGNGRYGVIAEDAELGETLCHLLREKNLREDYSRKGLERAKEFAWDRVAEQYEKLYLSLTK